MNPFYFPPRQIPTVDAALYVLNLYDQQIAGNVAVAQPAQEKLEAIEGVLKEKYPDMSDNLDLLIGSAKIVGSLAASHEDLDILKKQFRGDLPTAIRKALDQPTQ